MPKKCEDFFDVECASKNSEVISATVLQPMCQYSHCRHCNYRWSISTAMYRKGEYGNKK